VERAGEVDVDDAAPFVELVFVERCVLAGDAGRVDEDVDAAEVALDGGGGLCHGLVVGDVDGDARNAGAELRFSLGEQSLVHVPQADFGARLQQAVGDGKADPLRTAGDHGHAAAKIDLVHSMIS